MGALSTRGGLSQFSGINSAGRCFRLLFAAPAETSLQQGPYDFDRASLGAFALFIVPGNPVGGKRHYEAVINRRA